MHDLSIRASEIFMEKTLKHKRSAYNEEEKTPKFIKIEGKLKIKTAINTYIRTCAHSKIHNKIDNYPRMNSE